MEEEKLQAIAGQLRKPEGEQGVRTGEKMNEGNAYINRFTIGELKVASGDNILEIGMGNGYFVNEILSVDNSVRYTGCDFSETMIDEASKMNFKYISNGQAQFVHCDADQLPFHEETFNKVFTVNTLYFWDNPEVTLAEIHRVLKTGGSLIISIRPESVMQYYPFVKYGFTMYSRQSLADLLERNRFKVTSITEEKEPFQELDRHQLEMESLIVNASRISED